MSDAAGIESKLCGNHENLGSIVSWYICWCIIRLMGAGGINVRLWSSAVYTKSEGLLCGVCSHRPRTQ